MAKTGSIRGMGRLAIAGLIGVMAGGLLFQAARGAEGTAPVKMTKEEDHKRTMDLLHITELRKGKAGRDKTRSQLRQLRRIESQPLSQSAGPAEAEERKEGHQGIRLVEQAPPGDRGGFRSRGLWPRAQGHPEGQMGSRQHHHRQERRRRYRHQATGGSGG